MKRKLFLMSFVMMAGLPTAVFAKSGENGDLAEPEATWEGDYTPHYGREGAEHPLMDHLNAPPSARAEAGLEKWRMNFGLPRADLMGVQDPARGKGAGAGVSLKLDF